MGSHVLNTSLFGELGEKRQRDGNGSFAEGKP